MERLFELASTDLSYNSYFCAILQNKSLRIESPSGRFLRFIYLQYLSLFEEYQRQR